MYAIEKVNDTRGLKAFIQFPYVLHRQSSFWVPPLKSEEKKQYTADGNAMLQACRTCHFLLKQEDAVVGRISAFVNAEANEEWGEALGLFGNFECIDSHEAASLLFDAAQNWLRTCGFDTMRGPWSFTSQEFGLLVQGHDRLPMVMSPYHPSYYGRLFESAGFAKAKDLLVYELRRSDFVLPERIQRMADAIAAKYDVILRPVDTGRLKEETALLMDMANRSTSGNWGYISVSQDEAEELAAGLKQIVDPDFVLIAESRGEPIGYLIALPDINVFLKDAGGRLTPRLIWRLLARKHRIKGFRIWALGIIPEFQRRGIDTLFYSRLHETMMKKGITHIEANYILEDNMAMNNPLLKMGFNICKRYRVYDRTL